MKKIIFYLFCFFSYFVYSQIDYSANWEDFYSYNNIKSIEKVDNIIYALADNAVFTYDISTEEITKISSVNGLSGEKTTAFHFSENFEKLIIGYENGLIEVINKNGSITVSSDIANFTQAGDKRINHIREFGEILLLSTPFAIIEYNIDREEFGDTFFIGNNSTEVKTNKTVVFNNFIYAASENGLFIADATSDLLIDFNNWNQLFTGRNLTNITVFNDDIYVSEGRNLFRLSNNTLELAKNFSQNIQSLQASEANITVALNSSARVLDTSLDLVSEFTNTVGFEFSLNSAIFEDNFIYLATNEYGILTSSNNQISYTEIHPDGPLSNEMFSLTATENTLWTVYGSYSQPFVPLSQRGRFSSFNGASWTNIEFDRNETPFLDFVDITVDPENESRIFVSSFAQTGNGNIFSGGGLLEIIDNELSFFYNSQNSPLNDFQPSQNSITTRISGTVFDSNNNLWVADALAPEKLKKLDTNGNWTSINLSALETTTIQETAGITIDNNNTIWLATRLNGIFLYNENGNQRRAFKTGQNNGNLPNLAVRSIAIDANNRVWIGTREGLVVYNNALNVFNDDFLNANPIIIEQDGLAERLLGEQIINTIAVDGADNKWFGVDNGGVLYTNPNGQTTLASFTTENSPLPSNRILKIAVNKETGKVFFLTDKGLVAYNSNVSPFGETLGEVYAYPNPVLKQHKTVTIDGRNGTNLPKGTNVKIVDITGNLVFETNVVEGQELQGGKVVWNKKNLAGKKVASGVYIVLLSNDDGSQNAITKIAIVN